MSHHDDTSEGGRPGGRTQFPVTVTLTTPLPGTVAFGDPVTSLTLRPPTGRDIRESGVPFSISQGGAAEFSAESTARLIAKLSGLPLSAIDELSASDWQSCMLVVLGFFGSADAAATPSS